MAEEGDKTWPVDYRNTLVTLEKPIAAVNELGSQWVDKFRCVEVGEHDDHYTFLQPGISNERDNDVLEVRKDNVRGILYEKGTDNE